MVVCMLSCVQLFVTQGSTKLPCPWSFPGKNTGVGCHFLLQGIFPTQGSNPGPPALQADSLSSEPPGKPKNTGVGIISLLHGIFPSQKSNWGLLHCSRILYQLSYQGSPKYLSGLLFPSPGMEQVSPVSPVLAGRFFNSVPPGKPFLPDLQMLTQNQWLIGKKWESHFATNLN